jgi:hypothetical protein
MPSVATSSCLPDEIAAAVEVWVVVIAPGATGVRRLVGDDWNALRLAGGPVIDVPMLPADRWLLDPAVVSPRPGRTIFTPLWGPFQPNSHPPGGLGITRLNGRLRCDDPAINPDANVEVVLHPDAHPGWAAGEIVLGTRSVRQLTTEPPFVLTLGSGLVEFRSPAGATPRLVGDATMRYASAEDLRGSGDETVALTRAATLTIAVVDAAGAPISGFDIRPFVDAVAFADPALGAAWDDAARPTDARGRITIALRPTEGSHPLDVWVNGEAIDLSPGAAIHRRLVIARRGYRLDVDVHGLKPGAVFLTRIRATAAGQPTDLGWWGCTAQAPQLRPLVDLPSDATGDSPWPGLAWAAPESRLVQLAATNPVDGADLHLQAGLRFDSLQLDESTSIDLADVVAAADRPAARDTVGRVLGILHLPATGGVVQVLPVTGRRHAVRLPTARYRGCRRPAVHTSARRRARLPGHRNARRRLRAAARRPSARS